MKSLIRERSRSQSPAKPGVVSACGEAAHNELSNILAEFNRDGVPVLQGFDIADIPEEAFAYLQWASKQKAIEEFYDWKLLSPEEGSRQAVIRELIFTEADYIKHLMAIVEVFMGAAHALQGKGKLLRIDTSLLFSNIPDVLNASLYLWNYTFVPMIKDALGNSSPFNIDLMRDGFALFKDIMIPYEKYLIDQNKLLEYNRQNQKDSEYAIYLAWCHSRRECNRLQLNDFLVKPMQRLTKYGLLLNRIIHYTHNETEEKSLKAMEQTTSNAVTEINRSVRQNEEIEKVISLQKTLENLDCEIKDEEVEKLYNAYGKLNLSAPMLYCLPAHRRTLTHQADLRFRDSAKEARTT
ncbi:pleckstrin proteiny domain-containing family G member 5 [Danaus plexippus plexippus]|uniref:Pleckstrin proteiny domain-containing family G member 5 n=1 Tax=Danaus plexippus plexippus TaxID=278856 RepID=A0A212EQI9_DANPL|nr:pleckstrin proteiny domain-containing family G member 5 [Danaus plexippus plexippus]